MLKKLLYIIFSLFFFCGNAQKDVEKHPYFKKAKHFRYTDKDSSYFYFHKAIERQKQKGNISNVLALYTFLLDLNSYYFDLVPLQKNLATFNIVLKQNKEVYNFDSNTFYSRYQIFKKGDYYYKLGKYEKAEKYFLKVYRQLKAVPPKNLDPQKVSYISTAQVYLANIYFLTGRTRLAKSNYTKSLDFLIANKDANPIWAKYITKTRLSFVVLYQKNNEYAKARELLKNSVQSLQDEPENRRYLISAYRLMAKNYLLQKKPDSALFVLNKVKQKNLIQQGNLKFLRDQIRYKARAFAQKEDFETALQFYQEALKTTQKYYQTKHHPEIAELQKEIGELFVEQKQFKKSLSHFQKALSALYKDFKGKIFYDNPKPGNVLSKLTLIRILVAKQGALAEAYEAENNLDYLKAANQTAKTLVKTLGALKPEFESKVDFQFLMEETFPAFDQMMQTTFLMHQKTGDKTYLDDAFYFAEKSKAVLLLSAVQNTGAEQFAGVPDSLVSKEQRFRAKINHLEKKGFKNPKDIKLQDKLFDLKTEFYGFLNQIETNYPKYHQLKFSTEVVNLKKIQNLLQPDEALLEYYAADGFLYCFLVEKKETQLFQIPLTQNFSEKITHLQKLLSTPSVLKIGELKSLGNQVREKILPEIPQNISELVIARSGLLNYIPFGALYNSEQKKYLIENYAISYANSATLYQEYAQRNKIKNQQLLAFAPSFENASETHSETRIGLGPLLYNKKEVKLIGNYFEGTLLLNKEASLQAFENNAKEFGILHLATHAIINDKFPDYSYLAFTPEKDSLSSLLYIKDLYNYDLNADLVVLSACETGIGKLQKGAGMLSLARGFNYAGANALVTTQWKIDDKSSSFIMKNFYKYLADGEPKNIALRNAKLHYLATTSDPMQRHPYYWAGFVLTGNTSPIVETYRWYWWFVLGFGVICLVLFSFRLRKRLKS